MDRPLRLIATNPVDQLARTRRGAARRRLAAAVRRRARRRGRRRRRARRDRARPARRPLPRGAQRDRARARRGRLRVPRRARGRRRVRAAVRAAGRAWPLAGGARDALDRRLPRARARRPEIARIRGVAADSAVASLVERGLIAEAGRESGPGGAVRYRTTPLFERVFGLESLAALPRLDDLGESSRTRSASGCTASLWARLLAMHRHEPEDYDCPFCRVVAGGESKVTSHGDVVLRAKGATAFVAPKWWERNHGHVLVVANRHIENVYGIQDDELADVYRAAKRVAEAVRETYGCDGTSMRQHNEPAGNQDVWHFHVHVFRGTKATISTAIRSAFGGRQRTSELRTLHVCAHTSTSRGRCGRRQR